MLFMGMGYTQPDKNLCLYFSDEKMSLISLISCRDEMLVMQSIVEATGQCTSSKGAWVIMGNNYPHVMPKPDLAKIA